MVGFFAESPRGVPGPDVIRADFDRLTTLLGKQRRDANNIDSWTKPVEHGFKVPRLASSEHRALADLARTPWLRLVVDNVAQAMYVNAIVGESGPIPELQKIWLDNGCQSSQIANHRTFVSYGHSYSIVTPAVNNGGPTARIRFLSPRRVAVEFADPGASLFPSVAIEAHSPSPDGRTFTMYYPGATVKVVDQYAENGTLAISDPVDTGIDVVPVVPFANQSDLDGVVIGEVEPFIPTAQRINKTSFDRLLAQHYSSWKVKTATGLELPVKVDEQGIPTDEPDLAAQQQLRLKLAQDDILIGEDPDTKFGTLDATSLDPFVSAWRSDIEALAAVSQTPAHALTGQLVNLNAEALAAARAPLTQKVSERRVSAGSSYTRTLQLAASYADLPDVAADPHVRVTWQDMEIRSMSQAVDALGKAHTMLGIPARGLWDRIPDVEASDVQRWETLADEERDADPLNRVLNKGNVSTVESVDSGAN